MLIYAEFKWVDIYRSPKFIMEILLNYVKKNKVQDIWTAFLSISRLVQLAGAVEYTDCFSAEG